MESVKFRFSSVFLGGHKYDGKCVELIFSKSGFLLDNVCAPLDGIKQALLHAGDGLHMLFIDCGISAIQELRVGLDIPFSSFSAHSPTPSRSRITAFLIPPADQDERMNHIRALHKELCRSLFHMIDTQQAIDLLMQDSTMTINNKRKLSGSQTRLDSSPKKQRSITSMLGKAVKTEETQKRTDSLIHQVSSQMRRLEDRLHGLAGSATTETRKQSDQETTTANSLATPGYSITSRSTASGPCVASGSSVSSCRVHVSNEALVSVKGTQKLKNLPMTGAANLDSLILSVASENKENLIATNKIYTTATGRLEQCDLVSKPSVQKIAGVQPTEATFVSSNVTSRRGNKPVRPQEPSTKKQKIDLIAERLLGDVNAHSALRFPNKQTGQSNHSLMNSSVPVSSVTPTFGVGASPMIGPYSIGSYTIVNTPCGPTLMPIHNKSLAASKTIENLCVLEKQHDARDLLTTSEIQHTQSSLSVSVPGDKQNLQSTNGKHNTHIPRVSQLTNNRQTTSQTSSASKTTSLQHSDNDVMILKTPEKPAPIVIDVTADLKIPSEKCSVCPFSRGEMNVPVRNIHCGHVYDLYSVRQLLQIRGKKPVKCASIGCSNPVPIDLIDLEPIKV